MKILKDIAIFIYSGLFFVISWAIIAGYVNLDLSKEDKALGRVIETAVITRIAKGDIPYPQQVFTFQLHNLKKPLGTYRPAQDYKKLIENIKVGDTITVYFREQTSEGLNIDVFQIEKDGKVIQEYKTFNRNYLILGIIIALFGLYFFIYGLRKMARTKYISDESYIDRMKR